MSGPVRNLSIFGLRFSPKKLSIPAGTTVVWRNGDRFAHTITLAAAVDDQNQPLGVSFDSGQLPARPVVEKGVERPLGATYAYTFTQPGRYDYYCSLISSMTGVVLVRAPVVRR